MLDGYKRRDKNYYVHFLNTSSYKTIQVNDNMPFSQKSNLDDPISIMMTRIVSLLPIPICAISEEMKVIFLNTAFGNLVSLHDDACMKCPNIQGEKLSDHIWQSAKPTFEQMHEKILRNRCSAIQAIYYPNQEYSVALKYHLNATPLQLGSWKETCFLYYCLPVASATFTETGVQQKADEAKLDAVKQLAVTLNHEINNPLFIISMTLEDILAETEDTDVQRRIHASLEAVTRVSSAVKQLSEIRRIVTTDYAGGLSMLDLEASQ